MKIGSEDGGREGTVARCPHAVHSTSPKTLPTSSRIVHLRTSVDQLFLTPSLSSPPPATPSLLNREYRRRLRPSSLSYRSYRPCPASPDPANSTIGHLRPKLLAVCVPAISASCNASSFHFSIAYLHRILKTFRCFPGPLFVLPLRHL